MRVILKSITCRYIYYVGEIWYNEAWWKKNQITLIKVLLYGSLGVSSSAIGHRVFLSRTEEARAHFLRESGSFH